MERELQGQVISPGDSGEAERRRQDSVANTAGSACAAGLPDVATGLQECFGVALDWVGMRGIVLPVRHGSEAHTHLASFNAWVDLVDPGARGIHMSRLYALLQARMADRRIDAQALHSVLDAMLASQSGLSSRVQVDVAMDLALLRPALVSPMAGWQRYPMIFRARKSEAGCSFEMELTVGYSSTCPSSAALARHATAEAVSARFGNDPVAPGEIAAWLSGEAGSIATAHAQRSAARLRLRLRDGAPWPDAVSIVDRAEAALGTPLQTAVKRIDEQAFAERNAQNLMFCEDAARRLHAVFALDDQVDDFQIRVAHFESLHAHDAVASSSGSGDYRTLEIDP